MIETPGTSYKKGIVASRKSPHPQGRAYSGYTACSEIQGVETSTIQSGLGAIRLSLFWTYERTSVEQEICRCQRGNEAVKRWLKDTPKRFFLQREPASLWKVGPSVLRSRGTMSKNKIQTISIRTLVKKLLSNSTYLKTYICILW